jgi:hypothetical protein
MLLYTVLQVKGTLCSIWRRTSEGPVVTWGVEVKEGKSMLQGWCKYKNTKRFYEIFLCLEI